MEIILFYYLLIVLLSSNVFVHYYAIPVIFLAYFRSYLFIPYNVFGVVLLLVHPHEFDLTAGQPGKFFDFALWVLYYGDAIMISMLLLALLGVVYPRLLRLQNFARIIKR